MSRHDRGQVQCPEPLCRDGLIDPDEAPELVGELPWCVEDTDWLVCGVCLGEGIIDRDMIE